MDQTIRAESSTNNTGYELKITKQYTMAVKRSKKLTKQDLENVKVIEKRLELIEAEHAEIGDLKARQIKSTLNLILNWYDKKISTEIGKLELYIIKKTKALEGFIEETNNQNTYLTKNLRDKYGDGTINPEKGLFVPK